MFNIRSLTPFGYALFHGMLLVIIYGAPFILTKYPAAGDLTVSTIVMMLVKWAEQKVSQ